MIKSIKAREFIEKETWHYVQDDVIKAVEIAEAELEETIRNEMRIRAVEAFNQGCALMQICKHCKGDCFCEENFLAALDNDKIK